MRHAVLRSLLAGLIVSIAFAAWAFFRLRWFQHGITVSLAIGASSFAVQSVVCMISLMLICGTSATNTGALLRMLIALPVAFTAGILSIWACSWALSFGIDGGVGMLPQNAEEARFLNATDPRVAILSLYVGVLGSLASSTLAFAHVKRDLVWLLGVILSVVALMLVVLAMVVS